MLWLRAIVACAAPDPGFDVLLVSVDGTPPLLLEEEWASLATIPEIADAGALLPLRLDGMSETMAAHARILTGYGPEVTGIVNSFQYTPLPEGLTLQERARAQVGRRLRVLTVVNKPYMIGFASDDQPFWHLGESSDVAVNRQMIADITPDMLDALALAGDDPFLAFFHWAGVDQSGHEHGERSDEQRAALRDVDAQLGVIVDALKASGRWERTLAYVVTDHGFTPDGDRHLVDANGVWLATNDPMVGGGDTLDQVPWTILGRYGAWDEDARPLPFPEAEWGKEPEGRVEIGVRGRVE